MSTLFHHSSHSKPYIQEATMNTLLTFFFITVTVVLSLYWISKNSSKKKGGPPEPAGAWPIIGHLPFMVGMGVPHRSLGALADKYGPIFQLRMGSSPVLVVSDMKMAKECFTTKDKALANRPKIITTELMCYNYSVFAFCDYGPYWAYVRKMVSHELLSNKQVELHAHIRVSEVETSMREMYELWVKNKKGEGDMVKVDLKIWITSLVLNIVGRVLAGKRMSGDDGKRARNSMRIYLKYFSSVMVADALPYLRFLDLSGKEKAMQESAKDMDDIVEGWLGEHKKMRSLGQVKRDDEKDFIDVMLSSIEGAEVHGFDADRVIKSTLLALIVAATDTTSTTLVWALSLLLNNPHILKKAQDEIDIHVGRGRQVTVFDLKKLVYIEAIIKETLRLYPALPLSVTHTSGEDCVVGGYNISKGTRILTNLWKIQRDPNAWPDSNEFQPERFLTSHKDVDFRGQNFEFIPFGSGRRICPGISLAMEMQPLILARLIQGFNVRTLLDESIDMTESSDVTNLKVTSVDVLLAPRLSSDLY